MAAILQMTFSHVFSWMKIMSLIGVWQIFVPRCSNQLYATNGSDNGLAPDRRQAIIWTGGGEGITA